MFVVCGRDADLPTRPSSTPISTRKTRRPICHTVLHATLDNVDHLIATTPDVYLRVVDNFNEAVYAFAPESYEVPTLHEGRSEDAVRN